MILLPLPPSQSDRVTGGDGNLSIVVSSEVLEQVNRSIMRMNEEQSKEPARVIEADREQWNKVVCCVAVTAEVCQISISGRLPKDARMIVSAEPQHDSKTANGVSLCADSIAIFDKPDSNLAGRGSMHSVVMFYQASDISSDHASNGRLYVYRETNVNDLVNMRRNIIDKQLTVVP